MQKRLVIAAAIAVAILCTGCAQNGCAQSGYAQVQNALDKAIQTGQVVTDALAYADSVAEEVQGQAQTALLSPGSFSKSYAMAYAEATAKVLSGNKANIYIGGEKIRELSMALLEQYAVNVHEAEGALATSASIDHEEISEERKLTEEECQEIFDKDWSEFKSADGESSTAILSPGAFSSSGAKAMAHAYATALSDNTINIYFGAPAPEKSGVEIELEALAGVQQDGIADYLMQWAEIHGMTADKSEFGDIAIERVAAPGCEEMSATLLATNASCIEDDSRAIACILAQLADKDAFCGPVTAVFSASGK